MQDARRLERVCRPYLDLQTEEHLDLQDVFVANLDNTAI